MFFVPGTEIEIRILKTPQGTISGYFDAMEPAVRAVEKAAGTLTGNSTFYADVTTHDGEILRRRYLLIDCDRSRPPRDDAIVARGERRVV